MAALIRRILGVRSDFVLKCTRTIKFKVLRGYGLAVRQSSLPPYIFQIVGVLVFRIQFADGIYVGDARLIDSLADTFGIEWVYFYANALPPQK